MTYRTLEHRPAAQNRDVCHYAIIVRELEARLRQRATLLEPNSSAATAMFQSALDSQRSLHLHQDRCPRCTPALIKATAPQSLRVGSL